ncbi:MAG: hypothetical protein RMM17_10425 [Acidobacteriota bacterium]|nr:hypothetical protein [Blastocatellia bacterium]MDW8413085.1 hypothetical protein [Acidobacteriota bacterium]
MMQSGCKLWYSNAVANPKRSRRTIQQQLDYVWHCLYFIEVEEELTVQQILECLSEAELYLSQLKQRRLTSTQRERLARLERWINCFDKKVLYDQL